MSNYEHDDDYDYDYEDDHKNKTYDYNQVVYQQTNVTTTVVTEVIVNVIDNDTPDPVTNYIYGTRRRDYLQGTDQNDFIYGYQKGDILIDGLGSDRLYGNGGKNTYTMTADGQVDIAYLKKDKKVDTITSLGLEDRIDILGKNVSFAELNSGIGIYSNNHLQAIYTGDFTLEQIKTITI